MINKLTSSKIILSKLILLVLATSSLIACIKNDIEEAVLGKKVEDNKQISAPQMKSVLFLEKYNAPQEQLDFISKFNKLPIVPSNLVGTRQEDRDLIEEKNLINQYSFINGWICKVKIIGDSEFCFFDDKNATDSRVISLTGERKYYKDDIISVEGEVNFHLGANPGSLKAIIISPEGNFITKLIAEGGK
jgi:hypothetical protein